MNTLVTILYKILREGRASTSEYCTLNELSKINNNITTDDFLNKYSESYFLIDKIAKKIGMSHHQLIDKIEYADNVNLEELKNSLSKLFSNTDLTFEISSSDVINAIDTIRKLRINPVLMGLTYDEMSIYLDKSLVLKRKSSVN